MTRLAVLALHLPRLDVPTAGGQFLQAWLTALRENCQIELVVPGTPENTGPAHIPPGVKLIVVPVAANRINTASRAHECWFGGITPGRAVLNSLRASDELKSAAAAADVVEIHWNELLPLVEDLRAAPNPRPVTLFVHDVLTQKLQSEARGSPSFKRRRVSALKALRAGQVEPRLIGQVDHVFAFSRRDAQLLSRMGAAGRVDVVDPPVEVPPEPAPTPARPVLTFTGAMSRPVNAESVRWFIDTVWPQVHASVPEAVFVVAGAAPPSWLVERRSDSLVVTGFVEDLNSTYRSSSVFVAPLRVGAGLKFKVLDAMAHGLPVVATPVAAEGIIEEAQPGCFAAVTDDPREMAESIVAALRDPAGAKRVGEQARGWVQDRFNFGRSVQRAVDVYAELAASNANGLERPDHHES